MKKVLKYFIFVLFCVCCSLMGVKADNECTFEKDLTITFDGSGSPTINESFWPSYDDDFTWFKREIIKDTSVGTSELEWQLSDLSGLCPSKIYYCKVVRQKIDVLDLSKEALSDLANAGSVEKFFQALLNILGNYTEKKAVYLTASESQMETAFSISGSVTEHIGGEWLEWIRDYQNGNISIGEVIYNIGTAGTLETLSKVTQECGYLEYTGDKATYNLACSNTATYLQEYSNLLKNFKSCGGDAYCKSKELGKTTRLESRIKKYCSNILENYNYEEGSTEADCIDQCISMSELINTLKSDAGINKGTIGSCGFSARLLVWGRNIIKWVKYIIPVILIVLGILDFIRAITKDKEEEMKKAQDRFVKRLIAAALIFIIPFILGFILDKMGFSDYIDGCDVIEELNDY